MTEDQAPQFKLPQRVGPAAAPAGSAAGKLACVLLVVVIALQTHALFRSPETPAAGGTAGRFPAGDLKATAMKLEDRNLPSASADAWHQYLMSTALQPVDQARILYRIGKMQAHGAHYERAVANLYLAERLAGDQDDDLARRITLQVRECLKKMGRYAELTREMAARATPGPDADSAPSGQQVVARIGDERITVADFERMLAAQIEASISAQPGIPPGQADELRAQAIKQFADPQAKAQLLHQMVAGRVLAAEAKKAKLDQSPDYRQRLIAFADDLLASMLMTDEITKRAVVTPEDAERYYQANKDRYADPAKVTLAHIRLETQQEAAALLARAQAGEDFAELAEQFSTDERTKADGGRIGRPVTQDEDLIPGIGRLSGLQAAIWAAPPGEVLEQVYHGEAGWHVVKVLERTERAGKSYEEVKDQVERDTQAARRQEVTRQYVQELFEQHEVQLHPEAFRAAPKESGSRSQP